MPRISNLILAERGGLLTVDGSHVVVRPGPPAAPIAFASSGLVSSATPADPVIPVPASYGFTYTGNSNIGGTPVLPMTLTLNIPVGVQPGDMLVALVTVKGVFPGVGASLTPINTPAGWTFYTYQNGVAADVLNILYHVVTGYEGGSVNFVYPAPVSNFAGYQMNGAIIPVRGANTLSPIDNYRFFAGSTAGPSVTAFGTNTTFTNDLLLILMQPVNDGANSGGAGEIVPSNVAGTTVIVNAQSGAGALTDTLAVWSTPFAGPGATGNFVSPGGWPSGQFDTLVLALGAGAAPAGQLMGFPITADGVIAPMPIIQGAATALTAPQGTFIDSSGKLWVADAMSGNNGAIIGYTNPDSVVGNVAPTVLLQGPINTTLANPYDVGLDSSGNIYVANYNTSGTGQILIFASGSTGDVAPMAEIGGSNTGLTHPRAVCVDSGGNVYVLDDTVDSIKVWHSGNTGNVAPDQTITGAATLILNPLALRIDPNGLLWVTCGSTGSSEAYLLAFHTTDNGNVVPSIQLNSTALQPALGFGGPTGLAFDPSANIYVAVLGNKNVVVFPAGSSGTVVPTQTISGFPNGPWGVGVEE